ncbi:MAG: sigma-70 family RNA polymerase sigma factor [Candidatus Poribacteria bacterium]|nr:sigma-70 family RNA polymerase sigma factor [Candidatus Poribacteria bacterium]
MQSVEGMIRAIRDESACQDERHRAFAEIVRRYQDLAFAYAYGIVGNVEEAEDIAQEAFFEAWRRLDALEEPAAFLGWFRRIVHTRCHRRTRRARLVTEPLSDAIHPPSREPDPYEQLEQRESAQEARRALFALPLGMRSVAALFYVSGYSYREIGAFLEIPEGSVAHRLHAARKQLKGRLGMLKNGLTETKPSRDDGFANEVEYVTTNQALLDALRTAGESGEHVLIIGEAGTGKLLAARVIHRHSKRSDAPFAAVNGITLTEDPNAVARVFEMRRGGVIAVDEIDRTDDTQRLALRDLAEIHDVRLIALINGALPECEETVSALRRVLSVRVIETPPLRGKEAELSILMETFLNGACKAYDKKIDGFTEGAVALLREYAFPRNVAELHEIILRAVQQAEENMPLQREQIAAQLGEVGVNRTERDGRSR